MLATLLLDELMEDQFSLYLQDGGSDKVYHAQLKSVGDGMYKVDVQYGRRLGNPKVDTKTPVPVEYEIAKKAFDKVMKEKLAKGYSPTEGGVAYQDTALEKRFSGVSPQLLNTIDIKVVPSYINSSQWIMQQKFDGERLLIKKVGNVITGINKIGIETPITKEIEQHFLRSDKDFCIDGEIVGTQFYMFDILDYDGKNRKGNSYEDRLVLMGSDKIFEDFVIVETEETAQAMFKISKLNEMEN